MSVAYEYHLVSDDGNKFFFRKVSFCIFDAKSSRAMTLIITIGIRMTARIMIVIAISGCSFQGLTKWEMIATMM